MENQEVKRQVPTITLNERHEVVDHTKDVLLIVNGNEAFVTIRKLSTGSRNKIKAECTQTRILGGQPQVTVNDQEVQEKILSAAIIKAPFDTSVNGIKKLPAEVSDYLFDEYQEFGEPTTKKKEESPKD